MNAKLSPPETPAPPALPREGAFVLQLGLHSDLSRGRLRGRVEHVASGHARTFDSLDELQGFVVAILAGTPQFAAPE